MIERNVVSFSFKGRIRSLEMKRKMAEDANREKLEKNIKNFPLLTNKGVWIYILKTFGELSRRQVESIAKTLKNSDKNISLSEIFYKANEGLTEENKLPEKKWKRKVGILRREEADLFFNFISFDYDLPSKGYNYLYNKLREESERGYKKYIALKVADILGDKNAPVFKDLYSLESRGEIGIKVGHKKNPGYSEKYYITGTGQGTARMMEIYFRFYIEPYKELIKKNNLLALAKAESSEIVKKASKK